MKFLTATVAALGLSIAAAAPLHAQNVNANNLVNVNISNVANEIAENLSVEISQVPVTVQVPIGIAANVCPDLDANVISPQKGNNSEDELACTADSTSQALNQVVQRDLQG